MRVSDQYRYKTFFGNVQDRLSNLTRYQQELGTGKSIFSPSEAIQDAKRALSAEASLAENKQYIRNVDDGKNWVSSADGALQNIISLVNEIDALALSADNDSQTAEDRVNTATQINTKLEELMGLVNSKHGDRFLFGGHNTTNPPFVEARDSQGYIGGATANQDTITGRIYRKISQTENIQINIPGDQLFQTAGQMGTSQDIFFVISSLRDTIANNNTPPEGSEDTLSNNQLRESLDEIREKIQNQQTYLGTVGQRLDSTKSKLLDTEIKLTETQEQAEGVDMTDLVTKLSVEESVYNALLAINSRTLSQSLVDYLS